jgi:FKBP-type peptidyl-prolyl cis-trans isomerase
MVREDEEVIRRFLKRKDWEMQKTKSGLWYKIYESGKGEKAAKGKVVKIAYKVSLLDGTLCYSSKKEGPKFFNIGHGGVEAGLEEGILKLREGDKARFIMPPHLAHGLLGDAEQIPPSSIILYNIHVLDIKNAPQ